MVKVKVTDLVFSRSIRFGDKIEKNFISPFQCLLFSFIYFIFSKAIFQLCACIVLVVIRSPRSSLRRRIDIIHSFLPSILEINNIRNKSSFYF